MQIYDSLLHSTRSILFRNYIYIKKFYLDIFLGDFSDAEKIKEKFQVCPNTLALLLSYQIYNFLYYAIQGRYQEAQIVYKKLSIDLRNQKLLSYRNFVEGILAFMNGQYALSDVKLKSYIQQRTEKDSFLVCAYYYLGLTAQNEGKIEEQKVYYKLLQRSNPNTIFYKWSLTWGGMQT